MLKKMTVLAMALGALAGFVLPVSASANWLHHQTPIATNQTLGLTGNVRFQGGLGGVECQITSEVDFTANQTTGIATTFKPHPGTETENCKGTGGLAFCQIHNLTPQQPKWQIHTEPWQTTTREGQTTVKGAQDAKAITVTLGGQTITSQATGGFCPVNHLSLTGATVGFIPNQPSTISSVSLNGILVAHQQTTGGTTHTEDVTVSGTLNIEEPKANTYSI